MTTAEQAMRVVFAGGGTGGHLMPGAATAEALDLLLPAVRPLFLTSDRRTDRHFAAAIARFERVEIPSTPWHGLMHKLRFPVRAARAAWRTWRTFRAFRPHLVVGLGSHNCIVPVILARLMGIATALFESNAVPGRAVRRLAPLADCVFLQWQEAGEQLRSARVIATGNPVRLGMLGTQQRPARRQLGLYPSRLTLLVAGGSQGARALNDVVYGALRRIHRQGCNVQVVHLTGPDHHRAALEQSLAGGLPLYRPIGFLEAVEEAYAAADFVVSRAGGSTLAYLTALGLPSVLVPYPHAADDHQRANADVLARAGAAVTIEQSELSEESLAGAISALAGNAGLRAGMAEQARRIGKPHAALRVAEELAKMAGFARQLRRLPEQMELTTSRFPKAA